MQVALQPSPLVVLPSSQPSLEESFPSPHLARFMQGWPGVGQDQSDSTWQSCVHPSPFIVLPSSHPSPRSRWPFPQVRRIESEIEIPSTCALRASPKLGRPLSLGVGPPPTPGGCETLAHPDPTTEQTANTRILRGGAFGMVTRYSGAPAFPASTECCASAHKFPGRCSTSTRAGSVRVGAAHDWYHGRTALGGAPPRRRRLRQATWQTRAWTCAWRAPRMYVQLHRHLRLSYLGGRTRSSRRVGAGPVNIGFGAGRGRRGGPRL